jgi:hypothetical protein
MSAIGDAAFVRLRERTTDGGGGVLQHLPLPGR